MTNIFSSIINPCLFHCYKLASQYAIKALNVREEDDLLPVKYAIMCIIKSDAQEYRCASVRAVKVT